MRLASNSHEQDSPEGNATAAQECRSSYISSGDE
jgi:hypothetical protein